MSLFVSVSVGLHVLASKENMSACVVLKTSKVPLPYSPCVRVNLSVSQKGFDFPETIQCNCHTELPFELHLPPYLLQLTLVRPTFHSIGTL